MNKKSTLTESEYVVKIDWGLGSSIQAHSIILKVNGKCIEQINSK